jgi:hypothetical protein
VLLILFFAQSMSSKHKQTISPKSVYVDSVGIRFHKTGDHSVSGTEKPSGVAIKPSGKPFAGLG